MTLKSIVIKRNHHQIQDVPNHRVIVPNPKTTKIIIIVIQEPALVHELVRVHVHGHVQKLNINTHHHHHHRNDHHHNHIVVNNDTKINVLHRLVHKVIVKVEEDHVHEIIIIDSNSSDGTPQIQIRIRRDRGVDLLVEVSIIKIIENINHNKQSIYKPHLKTLIIFYFL